MVTHFRSNLRDLRFNLLEFLPTSGVYGSGRFSDFDAGQVSLVLSELESFCASEVWAGSFAASDREPLSLSADGDVALPPLLERSLRSFYGAGWHLLMVPPALGGLDVPPSLRWAASELMAGAHASASLWPVGPLVASVLDRVGTAGQRELFGRLIVERCWGGTMVLTEPDAGSDVGASTTRAVKVADSGPDDLGGVYHVTGVKRFITSADATPLHENTVHLVLARPEGAGPGTKGLSLFIVPKFHVLADGSLGGRNGVRVSNLESKLGINGSATCELTFGLDGTPCVGFLVGDAHDGIRQMFLMIEYARMMVGTKAMATLSTGYLNALEYARSRLQGVPLSASSSAVGARVPIVRHPDVRRMLMAQKAHVEGMRALVLFAGWVQDRVAVAEGSDERAVWVARENLLLPLVKGYCSEKAYELLGSATLQTFGGSGYLRDYPVEQYLRDAKIDTLYEGTTGIQALDLLFRKIVRDEGRALAWLMSEVRSASEPHPGDPFADVRMLLGAGLADVEAHLGVMVSHVLSEGSEQGRVDLAALHATPFLFSLAEVTLSWLLLGQAEVAAARLQEGGVSEEDEGFYAGKVVAARWFAREVLPLLSARRRAAESEDGMLMSAGAACF